MQKLREFIFRPQLVFVLFLITITAHNVFSQEVTFPVTVQPYTFSSARMEALGGVHAGIADDFYTTLFVNPAGLSDVDYHFNYASFGVSSNNAQIIIKLLQGDDMMPELAKIVSNSFLSYLNLNGPFAIGRVGNNWGIGFFNTTRVNLSWSPDNIFMLVPVVTEELLLKGGYGFCIAQTSMCKFDAGVLSKFFVRGGYNGPDIYANEVMHVLDKISSWPVETQMGMGFDAGLRFTIDSSLIFGITMQDIFSPVNVTVYRNIEKLKTLTQMDNRWVPVQPVASAGLTWRVMSDFAHRFVDDLTLSADFQGLLGNTRTPMRSPLLDLSAGLEVRVLEVLTLRGKWSEMLPGGGIGINFPHMQFDAAFYGVELGTEPGQLASYAINVQFSWRK